MSDLPDDPNRAMGPLELNVYKKDWRTSHRYLRWAAAVPGCRPGTASDLSYRASAGEERPVKPDAEAPTPGRVLARLLLARAFDRHPAVLSDLLTSAPVVLVDVPDPAIHARVAQQWVDVLDLGGWRIAKLADLTNSMKREDCDAISAVMDDMISPKEKSSMTSRAFAAVQLALPIIAITPSADAYLPQALLDAASARLVVPPVDKQIIERTIRIVTGHRCRLRISDEMVTDVTVADLLLSVRFDRTPHECIERITNLISKRKGGVRSRVLKLDELHGLDEAVAWARSTIADIEAWRAGDLPWEAVDAGMVLNGPSGTAKTTLARAFAAESGLPMFEVSYSKWQGSGDGHLDHLLREMRKDLQEARAKPGESLQVNEVF